MSQKILLIDDEPRITIALMVRLEREGYTVFHAINGLAGVEAAALHEPDLIVLDVRMPDIDGFEAYQRIRRFERLANVPVIFLSANIQQDVRQRAKEVGAASFIAKPFDSSDVLGQIRELTAHQTIKQ